MTDFILPELGEGVTAGDVLRVLVKPGDTLARDQPVLELETDKATIEVPAPVAGLVKDVKVKPGDTVKVGQVILSVEEEAAPAEAVRETGAGSRSEPAASAGRGTGAQGADKVVDIGRGARAAAEPPTPDPMVAPAAPSVRRMARELGIDIDQVGGSGPRGRISIDDVKAQAKRLVAAGAPGGSGAPLVGEPLPDFTRWGQVERQPMKGVRRKMAQHLSVAWATIPHVTQHDLADMTGLEELRKRYARQVEAAGGNLTVTAIAVKVVAAALKVFPQFNVSIDAEAGDLIYKKYVHIGVAVDTDRGLLVPVIRDADSKNIVQLSVELVQLAEKARTRKISIEDMQGGCFSISNLGGIGGHWFTPIVNAPEVAVLGIARARMEPVHDHSGGFVPRLMLPLSLSYDHRAIDGTDGVRFLRWIVEAIEQPFLLALQG